VADNYTPPRDCIPKTALLIEADFDLSMSPTATLA
jgi:hypothetical protein